jgi:hypothetical protein
MKERAQRLLWEAQRLEEEGQIERALSIYARLADLHQELAMQRRGAGEAGKWIDALAAITCAGRAGLLDRARQLADEWQGVAEDEGRTEMVAEIDSLRRWLQGVDRSPGRPADALTWVLPEAVVLEAYLSELRAA